MRECISKELGDASHHILGLSPTERHGQIPVHTANLQLVAEKPAKGLAEEYLVTGFGMNMNLCAKSSAGVKEVSLPSLPPNTDMTRQRHCALLPGAQSDAMLVLHSVHLTEDAFVFLTISQCPVAG